MQIKEVWQHRQYDVQIHRTIGKKNLDQKMLGK